jgi:hypothetical protein
VLPTSLLPSHSFQVCASLSHMSSMPLGSPVAFRIVAISSFVVGQSRSVTVRVEDSFGNLVPSFNGGVSIVAASGTGITGVGIVTISSGSGQRSISSQVAQTATIGLTDSQLTGLAVTSTSSVVVQPGPAVSFVIVQPADSTVGQFVRVDIEARDQFGNVATSENRDVTLRVNGVQFLFVDMASGLGFFSVRLTVSGPVALALVDTEATGLVVTSTSSFTYSPGVYSAFVLFAHCVRTCYIGYVSQHALRFCRCSHCRQRSSSRSVWQLGHL